MESIILQEVRYVVFRLVVKREKVFHRFKFNPLPTYNIMCNVVNLRHTLPCKRDTRMYLLLIHVRTFLVEENDLLTPFIIPKWTIIASIRMKKTWLVHLALCGMRMMHCVSSCVETETNGIFYIIQYN